MNAVALAEIQCWEAYLVHVLNCPNCRLEAAEVNIWRREAYCQQGWDALARWAAVDKARRDDQC